MGPIVQLVLNNSVEWDARVRKVGRTLRDAGYPVVYIGIKQAHSEEWMVPVEPLDGIDRYLFMREHYYDAVLRMLGSANPLLASRGSVGGSMRAALLEADIPAADRAKTLALSAPYGFAFLLRRSGIMRPVEIMGEFSRILVMDAIAKLRPSLIHAHDLDSFRLVAKGAKRRNIPVIYDSHELERGRNMPQHSKVARRWHAFTEQLTIRDATKVVTVAPSIAQVLAEAYGIEEPTVVVNAPPRKNIRPNRRLAERLGLRSEDRVVLYLGGVQVGRGIGDLLRAVPRMSKRIHVMLIGPVMYNYQSELAALLEAAGPDRHRIHVREPVPYDDVIHTAFGADLGFNGLELVCESYAHALPNKLFEYAFANVPILTSSSQALTPLVHEYALGQLRDDRPLSEQIEALLLSERPLQIPEQRRAAFIDRFCWESQAEKIRALYEEVLPGSLSPRRTAGR